MILFVNFRLIQDSTFNIQHSTFSMSSSLLKQRRKSIGGLSPPAEIPDTPVAPLKRTPSLLPNYFNSERPLSIEEEQHMKILQLKRALISWQNRWRQENEDKMKIVRKMDSQRTVQKQQIQRYIHARDQIYKEKQTLEMCFRNSVQQNTLEKTELKKNVISLAEETDLLKKKVERQNIEIEELKCKLLELSDANNNPKIQAEKKALADQNEALNKQLKEARLRLKESEMRDDNYNVLVKASLERLRLMEACAPKTKRTNSVARYVIHYDHDEPSNMYVHDQLSTATTGYETQSLGSLESLDSILEERVCKINGVSVSAQTSPIGHQPLHLSKSVDRLSSPKRPTSSTEQHRSVSPIILSSPDLTPPPDKTLLRRKGSLDFDRLPAQRRKRSSGFDFLKIKHSNPHAAPTPDGKRKRRTAEFADLLRKLTHTGSNNSSDGDKRHSTGGSRKSSGKRKGGSLKR